MNAFAHSVKNFLADEEGASAVEYALILGMVALAIISFVPTIRDSVVSIFDRIDSSLAAAAKK